MPITLTPLAFRPGFLRMAAMVATAAALLAVTPEAAQAAATGITVKADQARVIPIQGEPATVVIGNPLYAEVTVGEGMIVIHGRQFGTTNVLVLDNAGNTIGEYELSVIRGGSQNVTVYKAGSSWSYQCAPACESTLQVGDNVDYFGAVNTAIGAKAGLATGATKTD